LTPTSRTVVDSWAWIEYFDGSERGRAVEAKLKESKEIWTSAVSLAEIVSRYRRRHLDESRPLEVLLSLSRVGTPTSDDSREAGKIHAEVKSRSRNFGLGDAFVLQLARKLDATVLTGDPDFRGLKGAEVIE